MSRRGAAEPLLPRGAWAALGVTSERLRARPFRPALVVLGVGLAFAMLVSVLGGSLVARQQSLARSLAAVPESARGFRVDRFGLTLHGREYEQADREARSALSRLSSEPARRVIFFRALRVRERLVEIAAVDRLPQAVRLLSGRLPRTCTNARCEVLQIGRGGSVRIAQGDVRLARVGVAELRDPALFGYISASTGGRGPTLVLGPGVGALRRLGALDSFYRVYSWLSQLPAERLRTWEVGTILAAESRAQAALGAADSAFRLSGPDEALLDAKARGDVAANRLVLVGGETSALLLGFAIVAAIGLRRGLANEQRRLLTRGARRWQAFLALGAEIGAMTVAGAALGIVAGAGVVVSIAGAADLPTWRILGHALGADWTIAALAGGWAVATLVLALTTLTRDGETGRRRVGLVDVAALGAAAAIGVGVSRGALDPESVGSGDTVLLVLLPALVCFVAAVVLARLLAPAMWAAERLARNRSVSARLAVLALARAPTRTIVSCAFVTVALGLALFAASYRATLDRGASDQAAFEVPLDFTLSEGPRLVMPLDAAPIERYERLGDGTRAYPVVRLSATTPGSGASVLSPTVLGVPVDAVSRLHWRSDFSALSRREIARRLAPTGEPRLNGLPLPEGTRTLSLDAEARGHDVVVGVDVFDERGRVKIVPLGRAGPESATLSARVRLPAGSTLVGLQLSLPESEAFMLAHQQAEGDLSTAPTGALKLGPLRAGSAGGARRLVTAWRGWSLPDGRVARSRGTVTIDYAFEDTGARLVFRPAQPTDLEPMPVVASADVARAAGGIGRETTLDFQDTRVRARIVGTADRLPTVTGDAESFVLADAGWLSTAIDSGAPGEGTPNEVWLSSPHDRVTAERELRRPPFASLELASRPDIERQLASDPLAHATALALGAAGIVALVLAVLGFWVGVVSELRDERSDFFDLETQGLAPGSLRGQLRSRAFILVGLGVVGGAALGALLSLLVVSLVRVSGTNEVPEPPLRLDPAWLLCGLGVVGIALLAVAVAEGTSLTAFRGARPERASWSLE